MKRRVLYIIGTLLLSAVFVLQGSITGIFAATDGTAGDDQTIDIHIEKKWQDGDDAKGKRPGSITVDLKNADETVKTIEITPDEEGNWNGVFEGVNRFDDAGKEIQYDVVERKVDDYEPSYEQGEIKSDYVYPDNVSDVELSTETVTTDTVDVTGGTEWKIQPGLRTDYIPGTQVVFNTANLAVSKAYIEEFDADGNRVSQAERRFIKASSRGGSRNSGDRSTAAQISYLRKPEDIKGDGYCETDHILQVTFPDGVTVLDGTATGSSLPVVVTISNYSVLNNRSSFNVLYGSLWADANNSYGIRMDINFKVPGLSEASDVLLSFADIDVTRGSSYTRPGETDSRLERVYLLNGFDKTIYTLPLYKAANTRVAHSAFVHSGDNAMCAYALSGDGETLQSGFVTRAVLDKDGFTLRWTGSGCATWLFAQIKPFKLKVTVDENTVTHNGGKITDQSEWRFRDYGKPQVVTITPDTGYHVRYLKIDGQEIALDGFDENGYMEVTSGYDVKDPALNPGIVNSGTEKVKLYQRENGVIDLYLPAQFFAVGNAAPLRSDHWIDTSFVSNGLAEDYIITNRLTTTADGSKTWIAGNASHVSNEALALNVKQKLKTQPDSEYADYPVDRSQISWTGDNYSITGLPAFDADGNEYEYKVIETAPAGYDATQNGNDITNTLKQEYITVQGKKTWKDGGKTHNNAEEVIIKLFRAEWNKDSSRYGEAELQDAEPVWTGDTYKFADLPKYDDARYEYRYTVTEEVADSINTDPSKGDYYECVPDSTGMNFTNTLKGTTTFSGTKTWLDGNKTHNNADTEEITTVLFNESETQTKSQNVNNVNGRRRVPSWDGDTFTYTDLPKYDSEGYPYTYSVRESRVMGKNSNVADYDIYYDGELWDFDSYDTPQQAYNVTGTDIVNALRGSVTVNKIWSDDNNRDGKRPEQVTVHLMKGDSEIGSAELKGDSWSHTFEDLPLYDGNGEQITYTLTEDPINDADGKPVYTPEVGDFEWNEDGTGYTVEVTNTHEPDTTEVKVKKTWVDGEDADELRPDSITVQLFADGEAVEGKTLTLGKDGDTPWEGTFTGLPVNKSGEVGQAIVYSVKEVDSTGAEKAPDGYTASYSTEGDSLVVTNTHVTYTKAKLGGTKTLTGRDMAADEFEFVLEAANETTEAAVTDGKVVLPEDNAKAPASADGVAAGFEFGDIVFKEAGTYSFRISEVVPDADKDGIKYDRSSKTVDVTVVKDGNALRLESEPDLSSVVFSNEYSASGDFTPAGEKTLTGQSEVEGESEEPAAEEAAKSESSEAASQETTESTAEKAAKPAEDKADGTAEEAAKPAGDKADSKAEGSDSSAAEGLSSEISENEPAKNAVAPAEENADTENAEAAEGSAGSESAPAEEKPQEETAAENEKAAADSQEAEKASSEETETQPAAEASVAEETEKSEAKAADGDTDQTAKQKQPKGDAVDMAMTEGQFRFEIRYTNGSEYKDKKAAGGKNEAAAAGETAAITFDTLQYSTGLLKQLVSDGAATKDADGKYHISYYVVETEPDKDYYQNNTEVDSFEAVITDDGKGSLSVEMNPSVSIAFTNRYITDTATVSLSGLKVLNTENGSRTLKEGDFEFTVECADGAPAPEKTVAKNDAGGAVSFGDIVFTKGDIGDASSKTFTYNITETKGSAHGMSYDGETRAVTVTVTDNGEGKLTAVTEPASAPLFTFTNTYEPDPVSETICKDIRITKILKGADLAAGQFSFSLQAANDETKSAVSAGKVVLPSAVTVTNGADGDVVFDKITYNKVGTYTFRISEVIPQGAVKTAGGYELNGIVYDATEYTVTVVVGDDGEGKLFIDSQKLSVGGNKAIFTNEKLPDPEKTDKSDSKDDSDDSDSSGGTRTGDDSNLAGWLALLIAAGAGTGGAAAYRRKRRED